MSNDNTGVFSAELKGLKYSDLFDKYDKRLCPQCPLQGICSESDILRDNLEEEIPLRLSFSLESLKSFFNQFSFKEDYRNKLIALFNSNSKFFWRSIFLIARCSAKVHQNYKGKLSYSMRYKNN